ncbi:MAG: hypothetical protein H6R07_2591 [Proteobacteria bacterium]|nr:hypothetical protein [Pseudomonadota bacterium]
MESSIHALSDLFRQLGLADDGPSIEQFIATHRPLANQVVLADATFWTPSQAQFLREEMSNDADWVEIIDMLDSRLREG